MLIHKDLNGHSDLAGMTELSAMQGVGSAFMTSDDGTNRVQKSGDFVEISHRGGGWLRLLVLCEPANNRSTDGVLVDDQPAPVPGDEGFVPRTFALKAEYSEQEGDGGLQRQSAPAWRSRLPRFTLIEQRDAGVDTVTKLGRQRLWSLADGRVLRVRETGSMDDGRYFYGARGVLQPVRRERVARVELVRSNPDTLAGAEVLMEFSPASGLGFDVGGRALTTDWEERGSTSYFDSNYVFTDRVGQHFGRLVGPLSGDPSGTYAVATPAWVMEHAGAKPYLHLAAVYACMDDLAAPEVSSPRRLTCAYLDSSGNTQHSSIEFAPYNVPNGKYPGIYQYRLHRLAPLCLLLVTTTTPLIEPGGPVIPGTDFSGPSARLHWSMDGGASWVETDRSAWAGAPPSVRDGLLVLNALVPLGVGRALVFSAYAQVNEIPAPDAAGVLVLLLTPDAVTLVNIIPGREFSQGLLNPVQLGEKDYYATYVHAAEVGGTCGKLAWAQFDPAWMQAANYPWGIPADAGGLGHPFERPMLMVTEDDGATFERRLLPDPVASRTGFVVALDEKTLAVPVFAPRKRVGDGGISALNGVVYTSKNGGRTWRANGGRFTLPYYCRADGQLFPDQYVAQYGTDAFNRGELFPLVPLTDENERTAAICPGRPWLADSRIKEPKL